MVIPLLSNGFPSVDWRNARLQYRLARVKLNRTETFKLLKSLADPGGRANVACTLPVVSY